MNANSSITYLRIVPIVARSRTWLVITDIHSVVDIQAIRKLKDLENASVMPADQVTSWLAKNQIEQIGLVKPLSIGYLVDENLRVRPEPHIASPARTKGDWDLKDATAFFQEISVRSTFAAICGGAGIDRFAASPLDTDANSLVARQISSELSNETMLPALPPVASDLLRLRTKPDMISVDKLTDVFLEDPVLAARMCTIANHVIWRGNKPATSDLTQAILRVGTENALELASGIIMMSAFSIPKSQQAHFDQLWDKAQSLCGISRAVAKNMGKHGVRYTEACLVGLISVLGGLGLLCIRPDQAAVLMEAVAANQHLPQTTVELNTIGMTTARITNIILEKWRTPEPIRRAITESASEAKCMDNPLAAAHRISQMLYGIKMEAIPFPLGGGLDPLFKQYNLNRDMIEDMLDQANHFPQRR